MAAAQDEEARGDEAQGDGDAGVAATRAVSEKPEKSAVPARRRNGRTRLRTAMAPNSLLPATTKRMRKPTRTPFVGRDGSGRQRRRLLSNQYAVCANIWHPDYLLFPLFSPMLSSIASAGPSTASRGAHMQPSVLVRCVNGTGEQSRTPALLQAPRQRWCLPKSCARTLSSRVAPPRCLPCQGAPNISSGTRARRSLWQCEYRARWNEARRSRLASHRAACRNVHVRERR